MADDEELIRQARRGEPMPDRLPLEEQLAYQGLRMLYALYDLRRIGREQAAREKTAILSELRVNRETRLYQSRLAEYHVKQIIKTEVAITDYRQERTLENADRLVTAFQGVPCPAGLIPGQEEK